MADDARLKAARYRVEQLTGGSGAGDSDETAAEEVTPGSAERAAFVEVSIQQAIRRGEFDNLRGSGKPLRDLGRPHDPDWWIRRKIESERLTGLGPPALSLRVENADLDEKLDAMPHEGSVREALGDFNRRVIEARRQLLGGPPVVTPVRDVDAEVAAWRSRRDERYRAAAEERAREEQRIAAMTPRQRRRHRREQRAG